MRILGFLQNAVFYQGISKRSADAYKFDSRIRHRCFYSNFTGRKIRNNIGDELFNAMQLDNVALDHAYDYKAVKADLKHVGKVIDCIEPHLIICFGIPARKAVTEVLCLNTNKNGNIDNFNDVTVMFTNHPTARSPEESIVQFAKRFRVWVSKNKKRYGEPENFDYVNYKMVK